VDKALVFLYSDESNELKHDKLADRLEIIRDMIEDIGRHRKRTERQNDLRKGRRYELSQQLLRGGISLIMC
jgi:hypothetical protein